MQLYVDDNLMIRDVEAMNKTIRALKENGLVLKVMKELQNYLSCDVKFSKDKKRAVKIAPSYQEPG